MLVGCDGASSRVEDEDNVVLTATFDLDKVSACRASWGLFR